MAALPISLSDNQKSQFITGRSCEAEMAMVMAVKHSVVIATVSATQRLPQMTRMIHSISSFSLTHNHNTLLSTNEWHYYTNGYGCWRYISIGTDFVGFEELEALSPSPQIFWCRAHRVTFRERFSDSRSCRVVFIYVVRGRPGGLLQFSKGEAARHLVHLASA